MSDGIIYYYCESCKTSRKTVVLPDLHEINLEQTSNGLVEYSDLHICKGNILGVTNIQLDSDYSVRQVSYLNLPEVVRQDDASSGFHIPSPRSHEINRTLYIQQIISDFPVRLLYENFEYGYAIKIGSVSTKEDPIEEIMSSDGQIVFGYYKSEVNLTEKFYHWLKVLINMLQSHPPVQLGMILEALIHIFESVEREPEKIDQQIIRDLFTSHLISLKRLEPTLDRHLETLHQTVNEHQITILTNIVEGLESECSLLDAVEPVHDFVTFIMNLYLLERLGVITIQRPNHIPTIDEQEFDTNFAPTS